MDLPHAARAGAGAGANKAVKLPSFVVFAGRTWPGYPGVQHDGGRYAGTLCGTVTQIASTSPKGHPQPPQSPNRHPLGPPRGWQVHVTLTPLTILSVS